MYNVDTIKPCTEENVCSKAPVSKVLVIETRKKPQALNHKYFIVVLSIEKC